MFPITTSKNNRQRICWLRKLTNAKTVSRKGSASVNGLKSRCANCDPITIAPCQLALILITFLVDPLPLLVPLYSVCIAFAFAVCIFLYFHMMKDRRTLSRLHFFNYRKRNRKRRREK